jgi:hypothetical protein
VYEKSGIRSHSEFTEQRRTPLDKLRQWLFAFVSCASYRDLPQPDRPHRATRRNGTTLDFNTGRLGYKLIPPFLTKNMKIPENRLKTVHFVGKSRRDPSA